MRNEVNNTRDRIIHRHVVSRETEPGLLTRKGNVTYTETTGDLVQIPEALHG